jgi:phospholipase D1/2
MHNADASTMAAGAHNNILSEACCCIVLRPVVLALGVFCNTLLQAGEPYRVYIVIPMFPEGIPTSGSCQAILYYQHKTRQMMYK